MLFLSLHAVRHALPLTLLSVSPHCDHCVGAALVLAAAWPNEYASIHIDRGELIKHAGISKLKPYLEMIETTTLNIDRRVCRPFILLLYYDWHDRLGGTARAPPSTCI